MRKVIRNLISGFGFPLHYNTTLRSMLIISNIYAEAVQEQKKEEEKKTCTLDNLIRYKMMQIPPLDGTGTI